MPTRICGRIEVAVCGHDLLLAIVQGRPANPLNRRRITKAATPTRGTPPTIHRRISRICRVRLCVILSSLSQNLGEAAYDSLSNRRQPTPQLLSGASSWRSAWRNGGWEPLGIDAKSPAHAGDFRRV